MVRSKPRRWTPEEDAFLRQHYGKMPTKEIAEALGRKSPMVSSRAIKGLGLYIRGPHKTSASMTPHRLYADSYDQASAQVWDNHPSALGVAIKYLYCGWYEYMVWI